MELSALDSKLSQFLSSFPTTSNQKFQTSSELVPHLPCLVGLTGLSAKRKQRKKGTCMVSEQSGDNTIKDGHSQCGIYGFMLNE